MTMSWFSKTLGIATLGALMVTPSLAAPGPDGHGWGKHGRVYVGPRFFVGPRVYVGRPYVRPFGLYGGGVYGYGGPIGYFNYGYPYVNYAYPYYVERETGKLKIDTHAKDALVYVDGAYLGP